MPTNTEAPERIYVQLSPNGGTISYKSDPREVHDNGKPVYEYIRAPAAQGDVVDAATVAQVVDRASILEEAAKAAEAYLCTCDEKVMPIDHFSVCPQSIAAEIRALSTTPPAAAAPVPLAEDRVEADKVARDIVDNADTRGAFWRTVLLNNISNAITTFAARVRAEQREADAKIADETARKYTRGTFNDCSREVRAAEECAELIRRGGE